MRFQGLKALVVDDEQIVQQLIQANLERLGIKTTTANNGIEAIVNLQHQAFDFIIMDIRMPEQDGLDASRWIRQMDDKRISNIPIFALTLYSSQAHHEEIIDAGMNDHLVKPFQLEQFLPVLEKYF